MVNNSQAYFLQNKKSLLQIHRTAMTNVKGDDLVGEAKTVVSQAQNVKMRNKLKTNITCPMASAIKSRPLFLKRFLGYFNILNQNIFLCIFMTVLYMGCLYIIRYLMGKKCMEII